LPRRLREDGHGSHVAAAQERPQAPAYSTDVIMQVARLGGRCVLLALISLGLSIPLFDQEAIERTPWHDHLVFGGTLAERMRALEAHLEGTAWPNGSATDRTIAPPTLASPGQCGKTPDGIFVVRVPGGITAASIGIGGPGLAAPESLVAFMAPALGDLVSDFDVPMITEVMLSIPEPPPRSAA
jgi:hypothetical protein